MSSVVPALLQLGALFALLALTVPPSRATSPTCTAPRATWLRSAWSTGGRGRSRRRPALARLPDLGPRVLAGGRPRAVRVRPPPAAPPAVARHGGAARRRRLQHRRLLRHQHQLAVVLRRGRPRAPHADERPDGAELRVRRRRHGRRGRPRARSRPVGRPGPRRQLLGRPGPWGPARAAADQRGRRPGAGRPRRRPELRRAPGGRHARRRQPDPHRRTGRQPGGHQGARHQRWRVLQRQLVPPLREPEPVEQPLRGLPHPAHPARDGAHLRSARRRPSPGPRGPRGHVDPARDLDRPPHLGRDGRTGSRTHRGGRRDGGQGGPLRRGRVGALRGRHDRDVHGCGELHARLADRSRRPGDALQHAARRDRAGRGRVRALRDARCSPP